MTKIGKKYSYQSLAFRVKILFVSSQFRNIFRWTTQYSATNIIWNSYKGIYRIDIGANPTAIHGVQKVNLTVTTDVTVGAFAGHRLCSNLPGTVCNEIIRHLSSR